MLQDHPVLHLTIITYRHRSRSLVRRNDTRDIIIVARCCRLEKNVAAAVTLVTADGSIVTPELQSF